MTKPILLNPCFSLKLGSGGSKSAGGIKYTLLIPWPQLEQKWKILPKLDCSRDVTKMVNIMQSMIFPILIAVFIYQIVFPGSQQMNFAASNKLLTAFTPAVYHSHQSFQFSLCFPLVNVRPESYENNM